MSIAAWARLPIRDALSLAHRAKRINQTFPNSLSACCLDIVSVFAT
jgi:hypothetical protein